MEKGRGFSTYASADYATVLEWANAQVASAATSAAVNTTLANAADRPTPAEITYVVFKGGGRDCVLAMPFQSDIGYGALYVRDIFNSGWYGGWAKLVAEVSHARYSIPFEPGFSNGGTSYYYRDELGDVYFKCEYMLSGTSNDIDNTVVPFSLPVGFRPLNTEKFIVKCSYAAQGDIPFVGEGTIRPDGGMQVFIYAHGLTYARGFVSGKFSTR